MFSARVWLLITFCLITVTTFAQNNVDVDLYSGAASVSIPLYKIGHGDLAVPVSLEYSTNGVMVKDAGDPRTGIGWKLNAGGAVTRILKDLPDDVENGWMFNQNGTAIKNFTIGNDNNTVTCADEVTDLQNIDATLATNSDLEPDVFEVAAPGLSCRLVFDNINQVFKTIPYQDLVITYTTGFDGSNSNVIKSFVVTNDKGIKYTFDNTDRGSRTTSVPNSGGINYFKREYDLYSTAKRFYSSFMLCMWSCPAENPFLKINSLVVN